MVQQDEQLNFNPYVGPRPFQRDDQTRFYGRDDEADEIVTLILRHQLVLVYAQSGAGKTSMFNARIAPELEKNEFEVTPVARVGAPVAPAMLNATTNFYIFNALQSLMPGIDSQLLLDKSFSDYFPQKTNSRGKPLTQVIIFDQLEELFNTYPERWIKQQEEFFQQLADSLENNPFLKVVLIIREDHLAQLDRFKNTLQGLKHRFRLEPLRRDDAILAIKGPLTDMIINFSDKER